MCLMCKMKERIREKISYSLGRTRLFIRSFIHSFTHSFIHSFFQRLRFLYFVRTTGLKRSPFGQTSVRFQAGKHHSQQTPGTKAENINMYRTFRTNSALGQHKWCHLFALVFKALLVVLNVSVSCHRFETRPANCKIWSYLTFWLCYCDLHQNDVKTSFSCCYYCCYCCCCSFCCCCCCFNACV